MWKRGWNFLRPSRQRPLAPPEWAGFFSTEEYAAFLNLVEGYFRERGTPITLQDGVVVTGPGQGPEGESVRFGLGNLAQMCHQRDRQEWTRIIAAHFGGLEQSRRDGEEIARLSGDFAGASEFLAVRLYPRGGLQAIGAEKLVCREDLHGTLSVLVFDMPSTIHTVTAEGAAAWGRSHEELLRIGLENVRSKCRPDESEVEIGEGCKVWLISGDSFLTASHALLLPHHPSCGGRYGTLVAVPHRHAVICYPVNDLEVIKAAGLLPPIVRGMEREGPGSISPNLFWHRDGRFLNLPYRIEGQRLIFEPPEEFTRMLQELGGE